MERPYALAVVTALWRRPAVAAAVLAHFTALRVPGVRLTVTAVRSPEDPEPAPDVPGVVYVSAPNAPLSDKWNAVAEAAGRRGFADGVLVVGSDDLVSAGYVAEAVRLSASADMVVGSDLVFACFETGRLVRCTYSRMGAGRLLPRRTMERLGWRPWPSGLPRRLDAGMDRRLAAVYRGTRVYRTEAAVGPGPGRWVADVKSAVNLWPFAHVAATGRPLGPDERADLFLHLPALRALLPTDASQDQAQDGHPPRDRAAGGARASEDGAPPAGARQPVARADGTGDPRLSRAGVHAGAGAGLRPRDAPQARRGRHVSAAAETLRAVAVSDHHETGTRRGTVYTVAATDGRLRAGILKALPPKPAATAAATPTPAPKRKPRRKA